MPPAIAVSEPIAKDQTQLPQPLSLQPGTWSLRGYAMGVDAIDEQVAGSLLRSARLRLGLSQTGFATVLGIAQPTLSAYESGRRQPTLPTLLRMLSRAGLDLR